MLPPSFESNPDTFLKSRYAGCLAVARVEQAQRTKSLWVGQSLFGFLSIKNTIIPIIMCFSACLILLRLKLWALERDLLCAK